MFSEQSEYPGGTLEFMNKTNFINEKFEGKLDEKNFNRILKANTLKITEVIQEKEEKEKFLDESSEDFDKSIKNIFDNYNLSIFDFNNKEKLGTLRISEEETKKLENFFKNKYSLVI